MRIIHTRVKNSNDNIRSTSATVYIPRFWSIDISVFCTARLAFVVETPLLVEIRVVGEALYRLYHNSAAIVAKAKPPWDQGG